MGIENLTIGEIEKLASALGSTHTNGIQHCIKEKVIVRTYSAGAWYGTLAQKSGNEVVLENARRLWRFWCAQEISLSAVALYGVKHDKSKIVAPVPSVWLEAIEIIPCSAEAVKSLEGCPHAQAE